jgi:hypothetical protein
MVISHELRARANLRVQNKSLFFWRRTRLRLAKLVCKLFRGMQPLPDEFFAERCAPHALSKARRHWNAAAAEHTRLHNRNVGPNPLSGEGAQLER